MCELLRNCILIFLYSFLLSYMFIPPAAGGASWGTTVQVTVFFFTDNKTLSPSFISHLRNPHSGVDFHTPSLLRSQDYLRFKFKISHDNNYYDLVISHKLQSFSPKVLNVQQAILHNMLFVYIKDIWGFRVKHGERCDYELTSCNYQTDCAHLVYDLMNMCHNKLRERP